MSNLNVKVNKATAWKYNLLTVSLISVCVILARISFLNAGVSLEDFARFEILYNIVGIVSGLLISQTLIAVDKKGRLMPYNRGTIKR